MKIINNIGLPDFVFDVIVDAQNAKRPTNKSIRVTELIDSPLIRRLRAKHWDKIEIPVSKLIPAFVGTAFHHYMETHVKGGEQEVSMAIEVDGTKITGTCDEYRDNKLWDYKTKKSWAFIMKREETYLQWQQQLDIYTYMARKSGRTVDSYGVIAPILDYSDMKHDKIAEIPSIMPTIDFPTKDSLVIEKFIKERLRLHRGPYMCNDDDRWARNGGWALMKNKNVRAVKIFDTKLEAERRATADNKKGKDKYYVEERKSTYGKCDSWCFVKKWCPLYQDDNNEVS